MSKRYTALMVLSFMFGGFLLTTYAFTLYSVIVNEEVPGFMAFGITPGPPTVHGGSRLIITEREDIGLNNTNGNVSANMETANVTDTHRNNSSLRNVLFQKSIDPTEVLISPFMMFILFGGIIGVGNGLAIRHLTKEKEVKKIKAELTEMLLNPEEKLILEELNKAGGELTQKNLTELTGYSRVKTHRIIQKLETKKLVRKIPNGQTNRIILETGEKNGSGQ